VDRRDAEEERQHRPDTIDAARYPAHGERVVEGRFGERAEVLQTLIGGADLLQHPQGGEPGCHAERVARKGSRLVDGTDGRQVLHQISSPSEGRQRQATAMTFPRHVRSGETP